MVYELNSNKVLTWEEHVLARCGDIIYIDGLEFTNLITGIHKKFMTKEAIEDIKSNCREISNLAYIRRLDNINTIRKKIFEGLNQETKEDD